MNSLPWLITVVFVFATTTACEQKSRPKTPQNTPTTQNPFTTPQGMNQGANFGQLQCVVNNCPAANIEVTALGANGSILNARANQPVSWNFTARAVNATNRNIQIVDILPSGSTPPGMQINRSATPTVSWVPDQRSPRTGTLTVRVRDMTRCNTLEQSSSSNCTNNSTTTAYDTTRNFSWNIEGIQQQQGNNSNTLISTALPALLQILQGGDLSSVLGSVLGSLNGGSQIGGGLLGGGQGINLHHFQEDD